MILSLASDILCWIACMAILFIWIFLRNSLTLFNKSGHQDNILNETRRKTIIYSNKYMCIFILLRIIRATITNARTLMILVYKNWTLSLLVFVLQLSGKLTIQFSLSLQLINIQYWAMKPSLKKSAIQVLYAKYLWTKWGEEGVVQSTVIDIYPKSIKLWLKGDKGICVLIWIQLCW